jgi:endonuclease/exonuclease/phosphatase family metal-dependent hydrolase
MNGATVEPTTDVRTPAQRKGRGIARRRWLVVGAGILVLAGVLATGADRQPSRPAAGIGPAATAEQAAHTRPGRLRVATFNIHGGRDAEGDYDLARTAALLAGYDLVGLNEVHADWPQSADQAEQLGRRLDLDWLFAPAERRWWHDHFGNGLLSRYGLAGWRRTPLAGTQGKGFRCLLEAEVPVGERTVYVLLAHVDRKLDRQAQLAEVVDRFRQMPEPAILLGDLNSTADDPLLAELLAEPGVGDPLAERGEDRPRIDWIITRGLRTIDAGLVENEASDHPLVWAEVELP